MARVKNIVESTPGMSLVDCQDSLGHISDKIGVLSALSASFAESQDHMNKNVANGMWTILQGMKLEVEEVSESLEKLSGKGVSEIIERPARDLPLRETIEPFQKSDKQKPEDFLTVKKILDERGLNPNILGIPDLSIDEHIITLVIESLKKLSLVKATLHDEDLLKLDGYKLDGTTQIVDEVFNLLDAAVDLHTSTH